MTAVGDDHDVVEHTAASDAVVVRSVPPKLVPLIVKLVPVPRKGGKMGTLAGAFDDYSLQYAGALANLCEAGFAAPLVAAAASRICV